MKTEYEIIKEQPSYFTYEYNEMLRNTGIYEVLDKDGSISDTYKNTKFIIVNDVVLICTSTNYIGKPGGGWDKYKFKKSNDKITLCFSN